MHEHGLGVNRDFHLAKRYYDQVLEHDHKFYLASKLCVLKLHLKSWLTWITREKVNYWAPTISPNTNEGTQPPKTSWYKQLTNILAGPWVAVSYTHLDVYKRQGTTTGTWQRASTLVDVPSLCTGKRMHLHLLN